MEKKRQEYEVEEEGEWQTEEISEKGTGMEGERAEIGK